MGNHTSFGEKPRALVFTCPWLGGDRDIYHALIPHGHPYHVNENVDGTFVCGTGRDIRWEKICENTVLKKFEFDGEYDNCAVRLEDHGLLALEINFRKIEPGCCLSLWVNSQHQEWASRFCMNNDSTISPIENKNLVLGLGDDNIGISLVWQNQKNRAFTFVRDKRIMSDLYALTNETLRNERLTDKAVSLITRLDACTKLKRDGFVKFGDSVIDEALLDDAFGEINFMLGQSKDVNVFTNNTMQQGPAISNLWNKSVLPFIMSFLFGCRLNEINKVEGGQVALRFPGDQCIKGTRNCTHEHFQAVQKGWHIDGIANDSMPGKTDHFGEIRNFDSLVGVLLQDVPEPFSGEICFYRNSHKELSDFIKLNPAKLSELQLHGNQALPKVDLFKEREPFHGTGKKGDVFIANYMTAHFIAPNSSNKIRYACYFRIKSEKFGEELFNEESILNPWCNWSGLVDVS